MSWLVIITGHGRIQDQKFSLRRNCLSPLHNGSQQQVSKYTSQHTGCHFTKERHISSRYLEFLSPGHSPKINQSTSTTNFFFSPKCNDYGSRKDTTNTSTTTFYSGASTAGHRTPKCPINHLPTC